MSDFPFFCKKLFSGLLMAFFSLLATFGNSCVIIAMIKEKRLRTVSRKQQQILFFIFLNQSVHFRADFEFVHSQPVYFRPNDWRDRHASQCYNYPVRQLAMGLLDMQKLAHHRLHSLNCIYLQSLHTKCKSLSVLSILFNQNIQYVFVLCNFRVQYSDF